METHNNIIFHLQGCATALLTPFRNDEVDYDALRSLVGMQVNAGVDFLVPLGTTAETPCLSEDERLRILSAVRECAPSTPLIVGCGTNSLRGTIANMRLYENEGADGFLVVVPFYNKPTQEGLYQYFSAVASETTLPIVLYNVPGRTGCNMSAETTLRLSRIPNIVAIKEASGNVEQILRIIQGAPEGFSVLSGNDDQTALLMRAGAHGVVSVASNIVPGMMVSMVRALQRGDRDEATRLERILDPLFRACFMESNPIPAKGALSLLGLCTPDMRLPLTPATQRTLSTMQTVLNDLKTYA